jgi:sigma-B regulation protein RsbU (phosphoserine phosphatase)
LQQYEKDLEIETVKILIAEDELTTRMTVQVCLESWGYRVESVTNGIEAWDALKKPEAPHIAILDWEMPEIDGVEVCSRVKEMEVENPPYIILLTSRDSKTDIVKGFDAGADDYMTKPFNDNELRARVRVAERLVRTQSSLSESVSELRDALNQLEMLESGIVTCGTCRKIFSNDDEVWHNFVEIVEGGADSRFFQTICPECQK